MDGWQERLIEEQKALEAKLEKLQDFMQDNYCSADIDGEDGLDLVRQMVFMEAYNEILLKRISRVERVKYFKEATEV